MCVFILNSVEYADFMFHLGQYNHYMYHGRKREFYEIKQSNLKLEHLYISSIGFLELELTNDLLCAEAMC